MAKDKSKAPVEGTVVEAAMSSSGGGIRGGVNAKAIEQAMSDAVTQAYAKGITDQDEILKLKLAAREKVKGDARKDAARAAKAEKARAKG